MVYKGVLELSMVSSDILFNQFRCYCTFKEISNLQNRHELVCLVVNSKLHAPLESKELSMLSMHSN